MKIRIVLAMHGMPPKDFPEEEVVELVKLHRIIEKARDHAPAKMRVRFAQLDNRVRNWERTSENDPFWASSLNLAEELQEATGLEVVGGFNEFRAPNLDEALDTAARSNAEKWSLLRL